MHIRTIIFSAVITVTSAVSVLPLFAQDPLALIRAGQWATILNLFSRKSPVQNWETYVLAKAKDELEGKYTGGFGPGAAAVTELYLKAAGFSCNVSDAASAQRCVSSAAEGSRTGIVERLALMRASEVAEKTRSFSLHYALLVPVSLSADDPVSRHTAFKRLSFLYNSGTIGQAETLVRSVAHIQSPLVSFWKGRVLVKSGKKQEALPYYMSAARDTNASWLLRGILSDLRSEYDWLFSGSKNTETRKLVYFADYLSSAELNRLNSLYPNLNSMKPLTADTADADGVFLFKTSRENEMAALADASYTHLSRNPEILLGWLNRLISARRYSAAEPLFRRFDHVKASNGPIWRLRLSMLERQNRTSEHFNELIKYLNYNVTDSRAYDQLLDILVGPDTSSVRFASASLWSRALNEIPSSTGKGRFMYWLRRFYESRGMKKELDELESGFYNVAPGSYYAQYFWDKKINLNFVNEYNQLTDRAGYMRWISRHGGNPAAVAHIRRMGNARFLNPEGVSLWNSLQNASYDVPNDLISLYRLGEHDLGSEYYDILYKNNVSYEEGLRRWVYIGMKTGNLYLSVYYTRTLMRYLHIPEDPFSLPEGLLKQLYPRPYHDSVAKYSRRYSLDEGIIYGLMRQESMYRERVVSRSGAMGLMQIMPSTGKWMAGKMGLKDPDFFNPDTSIMVGARYFSDLIRQYDGEFRWASMAYNGGPGNLRKWKRQYYNGDFYLFLENLPVAETRNYVRFTYENAVHYKTVYALYP